MKNVRYEMQTGAHGKWLTVSPYDEVKRLLDRFPDYIVSFVPINGDERRVTNYRRVVTETVERYRLIRHVDGYTSGEYKTRGEAEDALKALSGYNSIIEYEVTV